MGLLKQNLGNSMSSLLSKFSPYSVSLIAEVACAHQGDPELLNQLTKNALDAGFTCIKFQIMNAYGHMSAKHRLFPLVHSLEIEPSIWIALFKWIREEYPHVHILCDVYDYPSLELVSNLSPDGVKIHSADLGNPEILGNIHQLNLPVLLGIGGSSINEVTKALDTVFSNSNQQVALMFGYQGFPTRLDDTGLSVIPELKKIFNLPIGFLDHTDASLPISIYTPLLAFSYGASLVEKHITLSRSKYVVDSDSSLEPSEFSQLLNEYQNYRSMSRPISYDQLMDSEEQKSYKELMKKRCILKANMPRSSVITEDALTYRRAETGVYASEYQDLLGRSLNSDMAAGNPIELSDTSNL